MSQAALDSKGTIEGYINTFSNHYLIAQSEYLMVLMSQNDDFTRLEICPPSLLQAATSTNGRIPHERRIVRSLIVEASVSSSVFDRNDS